MIIIVSLLYMSSISSAAETYDCGGPDKWITLNSAGILPDPVIYPGNVTLIADFDLAHDLPDHDVILSLQIEKQEPMRMTVPCLKNIGSCSYDVCKDMVPYHEKEFCELGSCKCPFPAKRYTTKGIPYALPVIGAAIFKEILEGSYIANMTFHNSATKQVYGCLGLKFNIKAAP
jgi:hypothetical protein